MNATHRCKVCGAWWCALPDGNWSLFCKTPNRPGPCCDNAPMGDQIQPLVLPDCMRWEDGKLTTANNTEGI